jgi:NitT/TauT family transport system permease protein
MLILLFGIGEIAKVMLIFVGTFFQLVLAVADGIRRLPHHLLQISYTLGARPGEADPAGVVSRRATGHLRCP